MLLTPDVKLTNRKYIFKNMHIYTPLLSDIEGMAGVDIDFIRLEWGTRRDNPVLVSTI